jgi:hypothetical protein
MDTIPTVRMGGRDKPGHDGVVRNKIVPFVCWIFFLCGVSIGRFSVIQPL